MIYNAFMCRFWLLTMNLFNSLVYTNENNYGSNFTDDPFCNKGCPFIKLMLRSKSWMSINIPRESMQEITCLWHVFRQRSLSIKWAPEWRELAHLKGRESLTFLLSLLLFNQLPSSHGVGYRKLNETTKQENKARGQPYVDGLHIRHLQGIQIHDGVIKWKHFPRYWPFVWGIHRYPVNSTHKGQWLGALMFSLICA